MAEDGYVDVSTSSQHLPISGTVDTDHQALESQRTHSPSPSRDKSQRRENEQESFDSLMPKIISTWKKCQDYLTGNRKIHETVPDLYVEIRQVLEFVIHSSSNNNELAWVENDIKKFLRGQNEKKDPRQRGNKDDKIDDCILWIILWKAVENLSDEDTNNPDNKKSNDANMRIIRIIVEIAPWLAFDNPYKSPHEGMVAWKRYLIKDKCKSHLNHDHKAEAWNSTPFYKAAKKGNSEAIGHMLQIGQESLELSDTEQPPKSHQELFVQVLQRPNAKNSETALSLCTKPGFGKIKALEKLLSVLLQLDEQTITTDDTTFKKALTTGRVDVVEAFLKHAELSRLVNTKNILEALEALEKFKTDTRQIEIARTMISRAATAHVLSKDIIGRIIKLNLKDVLEDKMKNPDFTLENFSPLQLAVEHQSPEFVEMFLQHYPNLINPKDNNKHPLWHNNYRKDKNNRNLKGADKKVNKTIRDMIVTATIKSREVDKMQDLLDIFHESGETVNELCFDISRFDSKVFLVSDFIRSFVSHQDDQKSPSYEKTIRYVEFPALDLNVEDRESFGDVVQSEHFEVFHALDWLGRKGVKEIMKLKIRDRLVNPHNEVGIGKYVEKFKVEVLDWRFLDMSISILKNSRDNIKELHLYASGKRSAIMHWLSEDGVASLKNELMSKKSREVTEKLLNSSFKTLSEEMNSTRKNECDYLKVGITFGPWNPTIKRVADLEEMSDKVVPRLSKFIRSYDNHIGNLVDTTDDESQIKFRPTKVALIDNGILSVSTKMKGGWELGTDKWEFDDSSDNKNNPTNSPKDETQDSSQKDGDSKSETQKKAKNNKALWSRIKDGRSFYDDESRLSSWLFASNPHGTQMANLICAIDPWCDLYVAKVTEGTYDISPDRVTKAIQWAIEQEVDIISMSFAILKNPESFRQVCEKAINAGIVLICSAHDQGPNISKAYPASFNDTIKILACDEFGRPTRDMKSQYDFIIQGIDVAAGVVPFLESDDRISGSSVATAIAAGLGSLTLSCDRLATNEPSKSYGRNSRSEIIKKHFGQMQVDKYDKFVLPEKFAGVDQKIKDGSHIIAESIINERFGGTNNKP